MLLFIVLLEPRVQSQNGNIKLNFDDLDKRDYWQNVGLENGLFVLPSIGTSGKGLAMVGNSTFSTLNLGQFRPKSVLFSTSVSFASKDAGEDRKADLSLQTSLDGVNWQTVWQVPNTLNNEDYSAQNVPIASTGVKYLRWITGKFGNEDFVFIDDIEIIPYSSDDLNEIQSGISQSELIITIEEKVDELNRNNQKAEAKILIEDLKRAYRKNLYVLQKVYDKTRGIEITEKTGNLIYARSKMASPTEYTEFNGWVKTIQRVSGQDEVIGERLKDIELQINKPLNSKKKGMLNFLGKVGNIVTGGKLGGLISSFKNIFSSVFRKSSLESTYPPFNVRAKNKVDPVLENVTKVADLVKEGKKQYIQLTKFFDVIEHEHESMVNQAIRWNNESVGISEFKGEIKEFTLAYLRLTDKDEGFNEDLVLKFFNSEPNAIDKIEANNDRYFSSFFKETGRFNGFASLQKADIKKLNKQIDAVDNIVEEYYDHAGRFLNLYGDMEIELRRPNPFKEYSVFNGEGGAAMKWQELKDEALPLSQEIKKLVKDGYVNANVRVIPNFK